MAAIASESFSSSNLKMRVGHAWIGSEHRETTPVIDPSSGQPIVDVPVATEDDAQSALEAAERAQPAWAALPPVQRAAYLSRVAELVRADLERLARIISREEGKPLREARFEIEGWTAGFFDYFSTFGRAAHGDFDEALDLANDSKYGLSAYLFCNDAKTVRRFVEGCDFGELYVNKIGPEQLHGHHTGYRSSGILGDDGTHGLEKYSRRRTVYTSWREETAAELMPAAGEPL